MVALAQLHGPALHAAFQSFRGTLPFERKRAAFAPTRFPAARWDQIAPYIRSGWRLQYCGPFYNPVSTIIRWKTYGPWSHSAMAAVDDGLINVIQVCAKDGCTESPLYDAVKKNPGRWYVSPINPRFEHVFDGEGAVRAFREHIGDKYGFRGIFLQSITAIPVVSGIAYTLGVHEWPYFSHSMAFCSGGVKNACAMNERRDEFVHGTRRTTHYGGGIDPFPHRQHSLCTPLDIAESLLWDPTFVALYPNDWEL